MKTKMIVGLLSVLCCVSAASQSYTQDRADDFYQPWVDYRNGEISVSFDRTPVQFAVNAIHATTGFQIVIPDSSETKYVNLRLEKQPLEPVVRSLISNIGYRNFALMYDEKGRPNRAVVLGAQVEQPKSAAADKAQTALKPMTPEERERLKQEIEHWGELKQEERGRIEDRLKSLPESEEREQLITEYGRRMLGLTKETATAAAKN